MNPPRFSVIIPVFNGEAFVARAIESALAQTLPAHEIIVIDDGSTDDTAAVVARFAAAKAPLVRYLHQPNAGVSAARNAGASAASGDWLAFLDADDWYYPHRLAAHAELIAAQPGLDFLTGDYDYLRPDGSRISGSMEIHPSGQAMLAKAAGEQTVVLTADDLEPFVAQHFGDTHTLSVPRDTFHAVGGYPTGYRIAEDVFFLIRLCARAKRVGVACQPLAAYLIHEGSATRRNPLQAQFDNVLTLCAIAADSHRYPLPVAHGLVQRLAQGRLNLAYALVREDRRLEACKAVLPNLWQTPGWPALRGLASILRG